MASVAITSAAAHLSVASGVRVSRSVRNVAARASYKVTLVTPDGEKVKRREEYGTEEGRLAFFFGGFRMSM